MSVSRYKRSAAAAALPVVAAILSVATAPAGCGGGPNAAPTKAPQVAGGTPHAIHLFATRQDGSRAPLAFGPATDVSFGGHASPHPARRNGVQSDLSPQTLDAGVPLANGPTVESPAANAWATAWALVWRASYQCDPPATIGYRSIPPWYGPATGFDSWYIYDGGQLGECSSRFAVQQNLLCVADKLAEIADAVGVTTWPALPQDGGTVPVGTLTYDAEGGVDPSLAGAEWIIPPQADGDRFIVRDLAIHSLGMLATSDAYSDITFPSPLPAGETCTQAFSWVANNAGSACVSADVAAAVFSAPSATVTPLFPPSAAPLCDTNGVSAAPQIAETALQINAQVLRAGGRLLHDLVRRDVYSDLAAAAQASAQTLDPVAGNAAAWGESASGAYGSIAHAARVLAGRWEIGDPGDFGTVADPACEGTTELQLLPQAFGDELSARVDDTPIRTKGEQTAVTLVERSGIVIPSCVLSPMSGDGGSGPSALASALVDQLQYESQVQNNLSQPPPSADLSAIVGGLSDAEILFAFERALRTWRLLTDAPDTTAGGGDAGAPCVPVAPTDGSNWPAGLVMATDANNNPIAHGAVASALQGVVVKGGLSRSRLKTDTMARAGGLLEASQCDVSTNYWSEWGLDVGATQTGTEQSTGSVSPSGQPVGALPPDVFQDAFHIGQALEHRLTLLQQAAAPIAGDQAAAIATGGVAELRSWAGSTLVHATALQSGGMGVTVAGMSYSRDLGISDISTASSQQAVLNAFGFVYGPPWAAECAANVRPDCPANFSQTIATAQGITDLTGQPPYADAGLTDNVFQLTVPFGGAFNPALDDTSPQTSHIYMVLLRDPHSAVGHGRVLGTLPLTTGLIISPPHNRFLSSTASFVDAPMQQELLHDAIDIGRWVGAKPPAIGDLPAAAPAGYCVDGVPRDLFVPLDNELISGTATYEDSWQHYLDLAQAAAATADSLGQQLIADDLQISEAQQSAAEQLANICGDFGALSGATVQTDGTVTAAPDDVSTSQCLNENLVDVVFLGTSPVPTSGDQTAAIKAALNCNPTGTSTTPPTASQLCSKSTLTSAQLNIVAAPQPPPTGGKQPTGCNDLINVASSLRTGLSSQSLLQDLSDPSLTPASLTSVLAQMQMNVDIHNHWTLTYGSVPIMDSVNVQYWPACLSSGCSSMASPLLQQIAPLWSATFRDCPNYTDNTRLSTLGCDGSATSELNMLKWRVVQALWMMGASGGEVPQGVFTVPVPTIFSNYCYEESCLNDNMNFDVPYLPEGSSNYYLGSVGTAGEPAGWCRALSSNCGILSTNQWYNPSVADVAAVGPIFPVDPAFQAFDATAGSGELPLWYRTLYGNTLANHILSTNDSYVFDQCSRWPNAQMLSAYPACDSTQETPIPVPTVLAGLAGGARGIDGIACPRNFGAPAGGTDATDATASHPWWVSVEMAQLGVSALQSAGITTGGVSACNHDVDGSNNVPFTEWDYSNGATGATLCWDPAWNGAGDVATLSPGMRVASFAGYGGSPNHTCGAAALLLQTASLGCAPTPVALGGPNQSLAQVPSIEHVSDIPKLVGWLSIAQAAVSGLVGRFYAQEIPARVVSDFASGSVGSGALGGTQGQALLTMEQQLQQLPSAWVQLSTDFQAIASAIQAAYLAVSAAGLNEDTTEGQIALSEVEVQAQMSQATNTFIQSVSAAMGGVLTSFGTSLVAIPEAAAAQADSITYGNWELQQLQANDAVAQETQENQLAQALSTLNSTTAPLWGDVQRQVDAIRGTAATVDASGQTIAQGQNAAAYALAAGTGQQFVTIAGQQVPLPVNTVLQRQASATEQRYQTALTNAKALAYMARRAIEQRIGATLDTFTTPVGPLDPPAAWADDICSLQGVNYAALATGVGDSNEDGGTDEGGEGNAAEQSAVSQFADAWVGDYVNKLASFVTYYNAQYPSHEGSDTAVLSLRYDLLASTGSCSLEGPNLLTNSGDLSHFAPTTWRLTGCNSSGKCLAAVPGYSFAGQSGPWGGAAAPGGSAAGFTWLTDVNDTIVPFDGGGSTDGGVEEAGGASEDASSPLDGAPDDLVVQQVQLQPGSYVLSWWDQARDTQGNPLDAGTTDAVAYVAEVLDPAFSVVAIAQPLPFVPEGSDAGAASQWSGRHTLSFVVGSGGVFTVAFGASTGFSAPMGSVAIAAVQLEQAPGGQPTPYVATTDTTMVAGVSCPMSDADLRAAFVHNCDGNGNCWYDLNVPLVIDTTTLGAASPLSAKLAGGNYNYRHVDIAANLVGTNVHDCANDPNPNCYGAGYIQYDLQHDASNAGIVGYDGNARVFDFGVGAINHGKALAAERYLTLPLSSTDQSLVSQPGIQHVELGGRPLDGTYHLRIWDSPDLNWSALQDIQLVVDYEYWSAIEVSQTGEARIGKPLRTRSETRRGQILGRR